MMTGEAVGRIVVGRIAFWRFGAIVAVLGGGAETVPVKAAFVCQVAAIADVEGAVFAGGTMPVEGVLQVWHAAALAGY